MKLKHGASAYRNGRCKCAVCTKANRETCNQERANRIARLAADPTLATHGKATTYSNWGCRCEPCTKAGRTHNALYYEMRKLRRAGQG